MKQGNIYLSENLVIVVKPYSNVNENVEFSQLKKFLNDIIYEHVRTRFFKEKKNNSKNDKDELIEYLNNKIHIIDYQQFKVLIPFLLMNITCFMPSSVSFDNKYSEDIKHDLNIECKNISNAIKENYNIINDQLEKIFKINNNEDIKSIYYKILKIAEEKYKYSNVKKSDKDGGEILIVYDSNADIMAKDSKIREEQRAKNEDIMLRIRMIIPGVNIEFFKIDIKEFKEIAKSNNSFLIKNMNSSHPLYHLASRVCTAFVEYYATYNCDHITCYEYKQDDEIHKINFPEVEKSRGVELFTPSFVDNQPKVCYPEFLVRKIMDVKDAIDIVGEGLDGNTHDYPPCPSELQSIFQGQDNQATTVRERYKFPFGIWFRGSSRICNSLIPSLFRGTTSPPLHPGCCIRNNNSNKIVYDETSMFYHFMAVRPQLKHDYSNAFEWLCMAQHYSAPSRVLDWTENILIALYFAVMNNNNNCDSAVWALNAGRLNELTRVTIPKRSICTPGSVDVVLRSAMGFTRDRSELKGYLLKNNQYDFVQHHFKDVGKIKEVSVEIKQDAEQFIKWLEGDENEFYTTKMYHRLSSPIAVFPARINERQVAQLACFTLYGGKEYDPQLSIEEIDKYPKFCSILDVNRRAITSPDAVGKPFLQMFVVPSFAKRKIREQLRRIGIHQVSLMPELENQARSLGRQWCSDVEL